jgi:hypothetical protein
MRSARMIALVLALAVSAAYAQSDGPRPGDRLTRAELERSIYDYADRYAAQIVVASDAVARNNPSAEQRRLAHLIKLVSASSVYDIATETDPFSKLVDLLAMVTLQSYTWIDEDRAEREFGERGEILIQALRALRVDIWNLAARILHPEQLQQVDALLLDWRKQNPKLQVLAYLRFDEAAAGSKATLDEIRQASGMFGIGEATKAVDEARQFAERAFYQAKRMPYILNWQMEALLNETLLKPEVQQSLKLTESFARSAERATIAMEKVPQQVAAEREAVVAALEDRDGRITKLLGEVRRTAASADDLAAHALKVAQSGERLTLNLRDVAAGLNETTRNVDTMLARQAAQPSNGEPFDIGPYVTAATELNQTVAGINAALARLDTLAEKRPWDAPLRDTQGALSSQIDRAFLWALALLAAFFVMLLAYRWVIARWLGVK